MVATDYVSFELVTRCFETKDIATAVLRPLSSLLRATGGVTTTGARNATPFQESALSCIVSRNFSRSGEAFQSMSHLQCSAEAPIGD
jgi:hypothetical protein